MAFSSSGDCARSAGKESKPTSTMNAVDEKCVCFMGLIAVSGFPKVGATGLEPVTPSVSSKGRCHASDSSKGLAEGDPAACTSDCTSEPENAHADPLETLAATLRNLSPADRARLAAMLTGQGEADARGNR